MEQAVPFGTWLKQQRKLRRMTQEDLAECVACSAVLVQKIESGERTPSTQLASLLGDWLAVTPGDLPAFVAFARGSTGGPAYASVPEGGPAVSLPSSVSVSTAGNAGKLPLLLTPLIGRAEEIAAVETLLLGTSEAGAPRLLTLTGPPGIGKTRLALQIAHNSEDRFADGVFFVGLAAVNDPDLVATTISQVFGVPDTGGESLTGILGQWIGSKQALLLLDNFEQVLDASPVVLELLVSCPSLKVLVTSREALHVIGEQQFHVPALATADPENLPPLEALGCVPSLTLFIERARAVNPDFVLTEQNAVAVATICTRLGGLPLAIELAAARIGLFSPHEMLSRLATRLPLLTGGPRNLPARQRTLRAAIDWSYNLLGNEEQVTFARLGVFAGGFTLAGADAVCRRDAGLATVAEQDSASYVLDSIGSLLDKNLLTRAGGTDGESRYAMLELIRDYALERLQAGGEAPSIRDLHARYILALAEAAEPHLFTGDQKRWLRRLEDDNDNLRVALAHALAGGAPDLAARIATAIWRFWEVFGYLREGRNWLEQVLNSGDALPPALQERTLSALGVLAANQGDFVTARSAYERGLTLARELPATGDSGRIHLNLAQIVIEQGDYRYARALLEEGLDLIRKSGWQRGLAFCLDHLGVVEANTGDYVRATGYLEEGLAIRRDIGDLVFTGMSLCNLGDVARYRCEHECAAELYEQGLDLFIELGDKRSISYALARLALVEMQRGNLARSRSLQEESLSPMAELRDKEMVAFSLAGFAAVEAMQDRTEQAVMLFAQVDTLLNSLTATMRPAERAYFERLIARAGAPLSPDDSSVAQARGREMTMEQAIECALQRR